MDNNIDKIIFTFVYNDGTKESVTAWGYDCNDAERVRNQIQSPEIAFIEIIDHFYRKEAIRAIYVDDDMPNNS